MKKLLEPFGFNFGQLQDIATLLGQLDRQGFSFDDLKDYIEKEKIRKIGETLGKKDWTKFAPKCKECNEAMRPYSVNTNPRDQVGGDHKTQWVCFACGHEEFSILSIRNWIKQMTENLCI